MKRAAAVAVTAAAVLSGFWTAPAAHANPDEVVVCMVLDDYPTASGVMEVISGLLGEGYSPYDVGVVMGRAVRDVCPEHRALVTRVVDAL